MSDDDRVIDLLLAPSAAMTRALINVGAAIERDAVNLMPQDNTTLDLLLRISESPIDGLRAVDLCDQLQKSPSHVSRVIDNAVAEGLVVRQPDPTDRRAHLVVLTEQGQAVTDEFAPLLGNVMKAIIEPALEPDEVQVLIELLNRVTDSARAYLSRDSPAIG